MHNCEMRDRLGTSMSEELFRVNWIEAVNRSVDQEKIKVTFISKSKYFNFD